MLSDGRPRIGRGAPRLLLAHARQVSGVGEISSAGPPLAASGGSGAPWSDPWGPVLRAVWRSMTLLGRPGCSSEDALAASHSGGVRDAKVDQAKRHRLRADVEVPRQVVCEFLISQRA